MESLTQDVSQLLNTIYTKYKVDILNYAPASLNRRIDRFIKLNHITDLESLSEKIINDSSYFDFFIKEITVNTTEMFRDYECWQIIREKILPELADLPSIRIWHAGCSSGEEVFSMAIILKELGIYEKAKIIASDLNKDIIEAAKKGVYPFKNISTNEENYINSGGKSSFSKYYTKEESFYRMNPELLDNVKFFRHDLSTGESFSKFDIILCRNVLIYFNKDLQERVFSLFEKSLFKKGFIVIGKKESMALYTSSSNFNEYSISEKVFRLK